ncbi:unnamed protein product [Cochlearia groenlandica]
MKVACPIMWAILMCYIFGHMRVWHKFVTISYNNVVLVEAKSFSKFEDLEIKQKLKTMNKPALKIIKTIHGERYGCVDFFKQPAFDHPSMKNHTYHYNMRRISYPGKKRNNNSDNGFGYLWENGVGCPVGTVPIRRLTKDDILALYSLDDSYKPRGSWNTTTTTCNNSPNNVVHYDQHHYAVARTKNIGKRFNGATMDLCITSPKVKPGQYSASRLHIQIGDDFIQAGITVNPVLYKDNQPRVFAYTKIGRSGEKSCYNSNCDVGMILVRQDYPLGATIGTPSRRGSWQSHYGIFGLIKDQGNGNWWFEYGRDAEEIGFWPSQLFSQSNGNLVEWGGEVYSASQPSPEMGYGYFPVMKIKYDAFAKRISILDGNYGVDWKVRFIELFSDDTRGYDVRGIQDSGISDIGHVIYFGGPGNI